LRMSRLRRLYLSDHYFFITCFWLAAAGLVTSDWSSQFGLQESTCENWRLDFKNQSAERRSIAFVAPLRFKVGAYVPSPAEAGIQLGAKTSPQLPG